MKYLVRTIALILISVNLQLFAQCSQECSRNCDKKRTSNIAQSTKQNSEDEFLPYNPNEGKATNSEDEFIEYNAKTDTMAQAVTNVQNQVPEQVPEQYIYQHKLFYPILSLIATILAGILVRFRATRKLRGVFLISSAVTLGFYIGACPCPISSFSYTIIALSGGEFIWVNMIWFLALIPITYFFHKVWCGWICHLGALQEFIFIPAANLKFLESEKSQKVMKYIRYVLVLALIIQVVITHSYLYDEIDPFKTAYNLGYNAGYTEWVLLALLLISSVFIYRPFCKSACPIGLLLGLVTKIKGAAVVGTDPNCLGCTVCAQSCSMNAINRKPGYSQLDNKDCIACGECADACRQSGIKFFRKSKEHNDLVQMSKTD